MSSNSSNPSPSPAPASLAAKWDRYYSTGPAGTAPFDSARPSSQLVDYLCSCLHGRTCSSSSSNGSSNGGSPWHAAAISQLAAAAPLVLPASQECSAAEPGEQQSLHYCQQCCAVKPTHGGRVLELGCGTGASARWLAQQGFKVTAVDISAAALQCAAAAAAAEGLPAGNPVWLLRDIFDLAAGTSQQQQQEAQQQEQGQQQQQHKQEAQQVLKEQVKQEQVQQEQLLCEQQGAPPQQAQQQQQQELQTPPDAVGPQVYDFIYDCQVYHVLVRDQPQHKARLPQLLHDLLNPGGCLMILAGNANEPEVGPNALTAEELLQPLLAAGFELVLLRQTRFDSTQHYTLVLGLRPLAWWVVLQRPR